MYSLYLRTISLTSLSLRVYSSIKKLPLMRNGLGIYVLSTNKGVMSDTEARKQSLGGEVLFSVF